MVTPLNGPVRPVPHSATEVDELAAQVAARLHGRSWWASAAAPVKVITGVAALLAVVATLVLYLADKPTRAEAHAAEDERELNEKRIEILELQFGAVQTTLGQIRKDVGKLRDDVADLATDVAKVTP